MNFYLLLRLHLEIIHVLVLTSVDFSNIKLTKRTIRFDKNFKTHTMFIQMKSY